MDKVKLIQLRNPWGKGEWTGDWSDDSDLWTTRMQNLVQYHDSEDDGIFWMDFNDFYEEFETVYVCRRYTEENNWTSILIEDKWVGPYAEGLPNKKNRGAKLENNP